MQRKRPHELHRIRTHAKRTVRGLTNCGQRVDALARSMNGIATNRFAERDDSGGEPDIVELRKRRTRGGHHPRLIAQAPRMMAATAKPPPCGMRQRIRALGQLGRKWQSWRHKARGHTHSRQQCGGSIHPLTP
jgi:hypothetical protein